MMGLDWNPIDLFFLTLTWLTFFKTQELKALYDSNNKAPPNTFDKQQHKVSETLKRRLEREKEEGLSWSNSFFGHSKPDSEDKTSKPKDKPSTITKKKNPTMPPALKSATVIKNLKKEKKQLEEGICGLE